MSVIFSDKELSLIEARYGMELIEAYEKIWNERIAVKRYFDTVNQNYKSTEGWTQKYWKYKMQECRGVLENQTTWLHKIAESTKGVLTDEAQAKLQTYLIQNDPLRDYRCSCQTTEEPK